MRSDRRARAACLAALLAVVATFGIVSSSAPKCPDRCEALAAGSASHFAPPAPPSPTEPATLIVTPGAGAEDVKPDARVLVAAVEGTLESVTMVNDADREIPGVLTPDGKAWKPTLQLGYGQHLHHDDRAAAAPAACRPGRRRASPPSTRATRPRCT